MSRGVRRRLPAAGRPGSEATAGLLAEARLLSGDFDRLTQAVADRVGLSTSDLGAMDFISTHGRVTAGQIAQHLHLTTGAITGLIDRLERAGFARRRPDADDRRRVVVVPTAKGERIAELFVPLAAALRGTVQGYSEKEIDLLTDFLRKMRDAVAATVEETRPKP